MVLQEQPWELLWFLLQVDPMTVAVDGASAAATKANAASNTTSHLVTELRDEARSRMKGNLGDQAINFGPWL